MTIRSVILFLLSILAGIFLILNWEGIISPVPVNYLFGSAQAPLGLILLLVLGFLWVVGIFWALMQQASSLMEIRKAYKEASTSKNLADKAELSRLEQTKTTMQQEIAKVESQVARKLDEANSANKQATDELKHTVSELTKIVEILSRKVEIIAAKDGVEIPENLKSEGEKKRRGLFAFFSSEKSEPVTTTVTVKPQDVQPAIEMKAAENPEPKREETIEAVEAAAAAPAPQQEKKGFLGGLFK